MLSIRLTRVGKKKYPIYRVVVMEKTRDPWGKNLEILGWKNPHTKETVLKADRIKYWLSVGAQPSDTVHNLLVQEKIIEGDKRKSVSITKKRAVKMAEAGKEKKVKEAEAAEAKKDEAEKAKTEAETPKEEAPAENSEAPAEETPAETPAEEPAAEAETPKKEAPAETENKEEETKEAAEPAA